MFTEVNIKTAKLVKYLLNLSRFLHVQALNLIQLLISLFKVFLAVRFFFLKPFKSNIICMLIVACCAYTAKGKCFISKNYLTKHC